MVSAPAWEQRKLGDEFQKVNERNDGSFGREHWISVAKMYFQEPEKVQSNNIDTRTYVMREGDIAFEGHPNSEFKFGRFVANDIGSGVVSELFPIYRHKCQYDNKYWKYAIQLERIMAPIFAKSITSSGNSSNKLEPSHFLRQSMSVATYEEQKVIGDFLNKFESLLSLHQRKLDNIKMLKKSLLQTLFPKDGEKIPELRFPGFTDDWEQRKLGEIFSEYSLKNRADLPPLTVVQGLGTILRSDGNRNLLYDKSNLSNYKLVHKDDFIVHLRSFEAGFEKANSDGIVSPAYHVFHGKDTDTRFYYPFFRSKRFIEQTLTPHVYGIRDGRSIDIESMKSSYIPATSLIEQIRIGKFIDSFDSLISLHQRKLDHLKELKKGLLQQMFV